MRLALAERSGKTILWGREEVTMRVATYLAVASTVLLLACSEREVPEPPAAPSPGKAPAAQQAAPPVPPAPASPLPTIAEPPRPDDPRRAETPCDRNEPGWKWVGTLVEEGRCVVGPCECVQG